MLKKTGYVMLACIAGMVLAAYPAGADELAEQGRAILEHNAPAVVTIELIIKQQFAMGGESSQEDESKEEITGTVIDPSGLIAVSLSSIDPASVFKNVMGTMGRDQEDFKMESQISNIKILLPDDTEIPVKVVLRDKDLDLAFLRPESPLAQPMAAVDTSKTATPQLLDPLISLNRLGKIAKRTYSVSIERVEAVVEKPRTYYIPGQNSGNASLGCPVFALNGDIVGIAVLRTNKMSGGGGLSLFGGMNEMVMGIIRPIGDILEVAKQIPADDAENTTGSTTDQTEKPKDAPAE